jgi:hypothetical protein
MLMVSTVGFQFIRPNLMIRSSFGFKATTKDFEIYRNIKEQIKSAMSTKFTGGIVPEQFRTLMNTFLEEYGQSNLEAKQDPISFKNNVVQFLLSVKEATENPYQFSPFHKAVRKPFDYYTW